MTSPNQTAPVLFVGHGSPMNALDDNEYTRNWTAVAAKISKPRAILSISAHWYTHGSRINDTLQPQMIYDMYGFPPELYRLTYPAQGSPELARLTQQLITANEVAVDNRWGYDHGTWSVLCRMYPEADIPVLQLSIDRDAPATAHFEIGRELHALRNQGVMIFASGNVVHNLAESDWGLAGGYPWAIEFDNYIKEQIQAKRYQNVIQYQTAGPAAKLAFPTPDHFYPLLYALGAVTATDRLSVFNDACTMGSMSMTSYLWE